MKKGILTVALALLATMSFAGDVKDVICPTGSCTILFDSQGRSIFGFGVRPTPNQNLGITVGMPFYDGPTATWYSYTGTAWSLPGGLFGAPVLLPDGSAAAPSLSFTNQSDMGFYKAGASSLGIANTGVAQWTIVNGAILPSASFTRDLGGASLLLGRIFLGTGVLGSRSKTLTDAAGAVSFVRIAVPTNANIGGKVIYTATSTDGANGSLTSTAEYNFSGADIAGTVTCGISAQLGVATAYARGNTLVCAVTTATSTTNCDLLATCTDNKAGDQTITFNWRLDMPIIATVTPQ